MTRLKRAAYFSAAICVAPLLPAIAGAQEMSPQGGSETTSPAPAVRPSLSKQLSKSGGVITPKRNIDPGIHVQAPDPHPNSTPVIPPSATGGNTAK